MALIVYGQQRFLHQILHLVRQTDKTFPQEGAQMRTQFLQKRMVGRLVAGESGYQQIPEPVLAGIKRACI